MLGSFRYSFLLCQYIYIVHFARAKQSSVAWVLCLYTCVNECMRLPAKCYPLEHNSKNAHELCNLCLFPLPTNASSENGVWHRPSGREAKLSTCNSGAAPVPLAIIRIDVAPGPVVPDLWLSAVHADMHRPRQWRNAVATYFKTIMGYFKLKYTSVIL